MARLISITDNQKRDAQVSFETVSKKNAQIRQVAADDSPVNSERLIKCTETTSIDALLAKHNDLEALGDALVSSDPEIDLKHVGRPLKRASKVYLKEDGSVLYAARVMQVTFGPDGVEKAREDFSDTPATIGEDEPALPWTGKMMPADTVVKKFVFGRSFQIKHINGLTFDFLYDIAKTLHDSGKLLYVGSGAKGQGPLIFNLNGKPYRGFLEGRIQNDSYLLVLHCSNLELKAVPA